mgnify:FL=1
MKKLIIAKSIMNCEGVKLNSRVKVFFFKELNKIHKSLKKNEVFIKRLLWEHTASIETVSWD